MPSYNEAEASRHIRYSQRYQARVNQADIRRASFDLTGNDKTSHESFFPWAFLAEHAYEPQLSLRALAAVRGLNSLPSKRAKITWDNSIGKDLPTAHYDLIMSEDKDVAERAVWHWLKLIDVYGFSIIDGIPPTPQATEALVRRIAFVRETHYGGFWDFTSNLEHGDMAYTDVALGGHTDTTYFTDPCGLQLFHLLSPHSTHTGGHNLLIDGFHCASLLRRLSPSSYDLLSRLPVPSHASGGTDVAIRPLWEGGVPVFQHENGELKVVRWNNDDRDVIGKGPGWEKGDVKKWYAAMREWEGILRAKENTLWTVMEPGKAVIFDNLRVLHGRSAFSGERRLCGAYVNGDDWRGRLRVLNQKYGVQQV